VGGRKLSVPIVYVVGENRLQNDLLALFLVNEAGMRTEIVSSFEKLALTFPQKKSQEGLALYDCQGLGYEELSQLLEGVQSLVSKSFHVAFFNVNDKIDIEKDSLHVGVRGFFYSRDPLESLLKGVVSLLNGEYWVSRNLLVEIFLEGDMIHKNGKGARKGRSILTTREIEILELVAFGEQNEVIADQLCISPHTVRTHLYNVFKKINVPNRLQASLWAAKNL